MKISKKESIKATTEASKQFAITCRTDASNYIRQAIDSLGASILKGGDAEYIHAAKDAIANLSVVLLDLQSK